jgi:hypothetical protein
VIAAVGLVPAQARQPSRAVAIRVSGRHLVDGSGKPVVLRGVNRSGMEYACIQGRGIFDGPDDLDDDAQVPLMRKWGVNEVNIGINEDCWLGINGVASAYGGARYVSAVVHETKTLERYGIYPVVSLFWEAPGKSKADGQIPMPDNDHAPAAWQSIARTFKRDPAVILRLEEEPYPAAHSEGFSAWRCWKNGDVQYGATGSLRPASTSVNCDERYKAVGMQSLVNIIRGAGATNVIQVPGVESANSMTRFLSAAYRVKDTLALPQLMAVVDVYPNDTCASVSCYTAEYLPVIDAMPFMAGEFGESANGRACGTAKVNELMTWFDDHDAGYSAWSWDTWGGCLRLIKSYTTGEPNGNWGRDYRSHVLTLASSGHRRNHSSA